MIRLAGIVGLMFFVSWYHPIHVTVTNIDMDPGSGTMDLSVKIFSDDFQDLILHNYAVQLRLTEQQDPREQIATVNDYIGESLQFDVNGEPVEALEFSRTELNEEAIWLYYRYEHGERIRTVTIRNRLMLESFSDQTNLVIVAYGKTQNGYRLNNKNTELTLNIKR